MRNGCVPRQNFKAARIIYAAAKPQITYCAALYNLCAAHLLLIPNLFLIHFLPFSRGAYISTQEVL